MRDSRLLVGLMLAALTGACMGGVGGNADNNSNPDVPVVSDMGTSTDSGGGVCDPAITRGCVCEDGRVSIQACRNDRSGFLDCQCPLIDAGPTRVCESGETEICLCPGSLAGERACRPDGFGWSSECMCPSAPVDAGTRACTPGIQTSCACPGTNNVFGAQVCNVDGSGYGACNGCPTPMIDAGVDVPTVVDIGTPDAGPTCSVGQMLCGVNCRVIQSDLMNCGACDRVCPNPSNATATCAAGVCGMGACSPGFANLDGNNSNGCEVNLMTDALNCGAAGTRCSSQQVCRAGECSARCTESQTACSGICRDTQSDRNNCGVCNRVCAGGQVCVSGACTSTCPAGRTLCGDQCVDLQSAANHCGSCGRACNYQNAGAMCVNAVCTMGLCDAYTGDCNGNPADGCETELYYGATVANCGACNRVCATRANSVPTCSYGTCNPICNSGFRNCNNTEADGCEINTQNDTLNCGGCGLRCTAGQACVSGACTTVTNCQAGMSSCNGVCSALNDITNCGACGRSCFNGYANASAFCNSATCGAVCNQNFGDCNGSLTDGCETDTRSNNAHCGACGRSCASGQSCVAGTCTNTCPAGQTFCNGVCVSVSNDVNNCGGCGTRCMTGNTSTATCVAGTCTFAVCPSGFGNCDGNQVNGCEAVVLNDVNNCGACFNRCAAGQSCTAGVCVADPCSSPGQAICSGVCVGLLTDSSNCGACGRICTTTSQSDYAWCGSGVCQVSVCSYWYRNCDTNSHNCETNVERDVNNCGGCNVRCLAGQTCERGICITPDAGVPADSGGGVCPAGTLLCAGSCRNVLADINNCGACNVVCSSNQACANGTCTNGASVLVEGQLEISVGNPYQVTMVVEGTDGGVTRTLTSCGVSFPNVVPYNWSGAPQVTPATNNRVMPLTSMDRGFVRSDIYCSSLLDGQGRIYYPNEMLGWTARRAGYTRVFSTRVLNVGGMSMMLGDLLDIARIEATPMGNRLVVWVSPM